MAEITFTDKNFDAEVINSDIPVLVDFWAPWCGPCQMMGPIIEQLAEQFENKIKIGKLNVDENPEIAKQHEIMSIPALIFFKGGKNVEQLIGVQSKETLEEKIKKLF